MILGAALLFGVTGCGDEQATVVPAASSSAQVSGAHSQEAVRSADQVVVSRSLRFGSVNAAPYGSFSEKGEVDVFVKAVHSADKIQGILDVVQPDYDVVIEQDGKRWEIHLWLFAHAEHGMYTYVSDTGTGYKLTAESTRELYKLIWGLRYEPKQAAANGDFVNAHGKLSNLDVWEKFVANVKAGIRDEVQVVQYTIEGGPIFDNLSFDGETIMHKHDNTHDAHGSPAKRFEFCKSIEEKNSDRGTEYNLTSCGEGSSLKGTFNLNLENQ
ncbi:hypothetical protein SD71_15000 [Cohnella kolymensis]|uniref:YhfM-like domain-containing protein n=2 Tax=Cohnella kolymensis TaxID=1590652 RepID=A0ABR5A1Q3_9BACL|nr:hypothetical protein SD71_15000 [Cohnella kolymensis]